MSEAGGETTGIKSYKSPSERSLDGRLIELFRNAPIPDGQLAENLGLFLGSKNLSRILFMHHLYQKIVDVPGIVMDLGTRWGQNLALFAAFRAMYEPYHRHRKLVAFDTFTGFPSISPRDGASDLMRPGNISVTEGYPAYLKALMECHEAGDPMSHITKFEIVAGDAVVEVPSYLGRNPETIVALAYFDFDLYEPTRRCLEAIWPRLVKGSVVGFDELNDHDSPGETAALMEIFGLNRVALRRLPQCARTSYFVIE
jgi:hypothetical protein